jgi:hypothetical protein
LLTAGQDEIVVQKDKELQEATSKLQESFDAMKGKFSSTLTAEIDKQKQTV